MSVGAEDTAVTINDLTLGVTYNITLVALSDYLPSPVVAVTATLGEPSIYGVPDWIMTGNHTPISCIVFTRSTSCRSSCRNNSYERTD